MKFSLYLLSLLFYTLSGQAQNNTSEKNAVSVLIDSWHKAASQANFDSYFNFMAEDAIFIGTDASENWSKKEFEKYAKPHFNKGKAWSFTPLQRNIYFSEDKKTAWFDELLDTQMKLCRGSGVLVKVKNKWKIVHYVLSISIPNELSAETIKLKENADKITIEKLRKN